MTNIFQRGSNHQPVFNSTDYVFLNFHSSTVHHPPPPGAARGRRLKSEAKDSKERLDMHWMVLGAGKLAGLVGFDGDFIVMLW